jgi:CRP-like cAMP-binding protein
VLSERLPIPLRESARPIGRDNTVHSKDFGGPLDNKLLSALPRDQFGLLAPHLTTQSFPQGLVLIEAGDEFENVYFLITGCFRYLPF